MSGQDWNDQRIEIIIGTLLRTGVMLAAGFVAVGAIVYLAGHGMELPSFKAFHGEPANLKTLSAIVHGALHGDGQDIMQFGLLLLIATPIARVLFAAIGFLIEHDYLYVAFTLMVLAILLYSLLSSGV